VLFIVNWDDSRVPRAEAFELFDAIGAADKRLHAQPGEHGNVPEEEFTATEEFFARYLTGGTGLTARGYIGARDRSGCVPANPVRARRRLRVQDPSG
jgi:hypothetical protein